MHISGSLLAADFACLSTEVRRAEAAGVDSFHFDWMDGHYVPNIALSPGHLTALRPFTCLPFHVHLELANPQHVLERFPLWHADAIIVCRNTLADWRHTFALIRSHAAQVGLSLDQDDSLDDLGELLPELDLLVILGVYPGFGGQAMQASTLSRIRDARKLIRRMGLHLGLAVDGGVTAENAHALRQAGADTLIIGTSLFRAPDASSLIRMLREAV